MNRIANRPRRVLGRLTTLWRRQRASRRHALARLSAAGALAALAALAACENPVRVTTDHLEATEVVVRGEGGDVLARTVDNARWDAAPLAIPEGSALNVRVSFVDLQGREFTLDAGRDHRVRVEWQREGIAGWEPVDGSERLHGLAAGETSARLLAWHVTHPDFISPWLPVRVVRP
jgi:hypothetical protein